MLTVVIRKLLRNRWMVLCLLFGSILAVALLSSIPLYTDGILQRMLTKDLEAFQLTQGNFPGYYSIKTNLLFPLEEVDLAKAFREYNDRIEGKLMPLFGIPFLSHATVLGLELMEAAPAGRREPREQVRQMQVQSVSGLAQHVKLLDGRIFSSEQVDGVYEAMVTPETLKERDLIVGRTYTLSEMRETKLELFSVKVVGVFTVGQDGDAFWFQGLWAYKDSFLIDHSLFLRDFIDRGSPYFAAAQWYYALDYHKITLANLSRILATMGSHERLAADSRVLDLEAPARPVLQQYLTREKQLRSTLWFIQSPLLILLVLYMIMVSTLIMDNERNEIAVLKSRGAGTGQVFVLYLLQSLVIGILSLGVGLPLGFLLCRMTGFSAGFLQFVQRAGLPVLLDRASVLYGCAGVLLFISSMLVPAYLASRTTIVLHKREKSRSTRRTILARFPLDLLLAGIVTYGVFLAFSRGKVLDMVGARAPQVPIDPLLFFLSSLFILSAGALLLRVFPLLIRFLFRLGRGSWPPDLYAALLRIGRSFGLEQFPMLFLILSFSIGLLSASTARTMNQNGEEGIRYSIGADLRIRERWPGETAAMAGAGPSGGASSDAPAEYSEPSFRRFAELPGAELATKVLMKDKVLAMGADGSSGTVSLMAVIPHEFGRIAWFRSDLLPYHIFQYLNLLTVNPGAFLASRSFEARYGVKVGDTISVTWAGQRYLRGKVIAFVDYWPGFDPAGRRDAGMPDDLLVLNLSTVQMNMALEPYEVWLKRKPGVSSEEIYRQMAGMKIDVMDLKNADQEIIRQKNDPLVQGMNGALTVGFLATMAVCAVGFLIYWILSLQGRTLLFGILRAVGLPKGAVARMLLWEQLFISGTSIAIGTLIGRIATALFVPLLKLTAGAGSRALPFKVVFLAGDELRIFLIVGCMLAAAGAILMVTIARIGITQALKLGEE